MLKNLFSGGLEKNAIIFPFIMLAMMWGFFMLQNMGWFDSCNGAIIPLNFKGLSGVLFSPLLHGSWDHLFGNTIPMAVMLFLLFQFYQPLAKKIFFGGWALSGLLVWLLPPIDIFTGSYRYICIVGASGLIYALAFFLFTSGLIRSNRKYLTISLIVALYYGGLVWGIFPQELFSTDPAASRISWQAHLAGAIVGVSLAFYYRKRGEKTKKYIWEFPNYYSEKDDKLWQEYIANHPEDFREMPHKEADNVWEYLDEIRKRGTE